MWPWLLIQLTSGTVTSGPVDLVDVDVMFCRSVTMDASITREVTSEASLTRTVTVDVER